MKVLFLTLIDMSSLKYGGIYQDLISEFVDAGDEVYSVFPTERRKKEKTTLIKEGNHTALKIRTLNIQKTNILEKAISTLTICKVFNKKIKKYLKGVKFDLIIYSTPPITFVDTVKYFKKRDNAKTYLLLKDIFPQNAVDIGLIKKGGFIYNFFRKKEKNLYKVSDYIGCMSNANVRYVLNNNSEISADRVEVSANGLKCAGKILSREEKIEVRNKYHIPQDKRVFIYGGNFGKPQDCDFIVKCMESQIDNDNVFFCMVGNGTDFDKIKRYAESVNSKNILLLNYLEGEEYIRLVASADVGMIFLDYRFTIPNFPSRLLSYLSVGVPVLAMTDVNSDIKDVITENNFGWWQESSDVNNFVGVMDNINKQSDKQIEEMGYNGREYLINNFLTKDAYQKIKDKM